MKKALILLMTLAMMVSTMSCGLSHVRMTSQPGIGETPSPAAEEKDLSATNADAQKTPEILRPQASAMPTVSPTPRPAQTPKAEDSRPFGESSEQTKEPVPQTDNTVSAASSPNTPLPTPAPQMPSAEHPQNSAPTQTTHRTETDTAAPNPQPAAPADTGEHTATVVADRQPIDTLQQATLPDLLTAENFPDPSLLQALREQHPDGLTRETIGSVTSFATGATIHDTTGIELLTGLKELNLFGTNDFPSVNVSTMPNLSTLHLSGSSLQMLDLRSNSQLRSLSYYGPCSNAETVELHSCPLLEKLYIEAPIRSLDLSACPMLKELTLRGCQLDSIDLSQNPELQDLDCAAPLSTLDVTRCSKLESLYFQGDISQLDLSCNPQLKELSVIAKLNMLDLSHNPELSLLQCEYNTLRSLDVSMLPKLERLICYDNALTELDLSHNPQLQVLNCADNSLSSLDLRACPKLTFLCADSQRSVSVKAMLINGNYVIDLTPLVGAENLDRVMDANGIPLPTGKVCFGDALPEAFTYLYNTGCPLGNLDVTVTLTAPQEEAPTEPETPADAEGPAWKEAYKAFLDTRGRSDWLYALYDLNGDGVPEMIVKSGDCEANYLGTLYTCTADGRVGVIGTRSMSHAGLCGLSSEHALVEVWGHQGCYAISKWTWDGVSFSVETLLPEKNYGHEMYPYHTESGSSLLSYLPMTVCSDYTGLDWNGNPWDENHLILAQGPVGQQETIEPEAPAEPEVLPEPETTSEPPACDHLWDGESPYMMGGETLWHLRCENCGEEYYVDDEGLDAERLKRKTADGDPFVMEAQEIAASGLSEYDMMEACAAVTAGRCTNSNCCWSDANHLISMLQVCGIRAEFIHISEWLDRNGYTAEQFYNENGEWTWPSGLGSNHAWNRCTLSDGTWYEVDTSYGFGIYQISAPNSYLY